MNTKEIIFSQLKTRFQAANLKMVMLSYDMKTKLSKCKGLHFDNSEILIDITSKENLMIRTMLIIKIKRLIAFEFLELIVNIDVEEEKFNLYVKDLNNKLIKVDIW